MNIIKSILQRKVGIVISLLLLFTVALLGIIRDPLIIGPDEGMELSKSLLISRYSDVAAGVWNDQPWLYSQIFSLVFHSNIEIARIATLFCYVAFCAMLVYICKDSIHPMALAVFPWLLWCWKELLDITISSMCEVPAICLAASGILMLCRSRHSALWITFSGAVVGLAAGIKLTGILMAVPLPMVMLQKEVDLRGGWHNIRYNRFLFDGLLWLGAFLTAVAIGIWISPSFKVENVWGLHSTISSNGLEEIRRHHLGLHDIFCAPGCLLLAVLGAFHGFRSAAGPIRLMTTWAIVTTSVSLAVNAGHYPFWFFYRLHFALPICVLAMLAIDAVILHFGQVRNGRTDSAKQSAMQHFTYATIAMFITFDGWQLVTQSRNLFRKPTAESDPIVRRLTLYSGRISSSYSNDNIRIARAGLLMLPSLTITSLKRFWSGSLTESSLVSAINENNVDALLLQLHLDGEGEQWEHVLTNKYVRVFSTDQKILYLHRHLNPIPEHQTITQLKASGIIK